ncbi:hypothetical protein [Ammoniphilus resinae]|uniref:Uncharacterized protein n=1 Tax=Ammoniphilus resinae TaxID=861532 RepID=A0ABS4GP61_9BACL|nr:hypothetical protein [Ammoniphilus resinae]MBP1932049.1 hypothetical protein [Ammoniphilus resinae]
MFGMFKKRVTPAELYRKEKKSHSGISPDRLKRGADRQWRRLHDPEFQTKEMIETLNRVVPPKNKR